MVGEGLSKVPDSPVRRVGEIIAVQEANQLFIVGQVADACEVEPVDDS